MNFKKLESMIKVYLQERKISKKDFCKSIGVTTQGFGKMIKTQNVKIETLEKMSKEFGVSPSVFFNNGEKSIGFLTDNDENAVENNRELIKINELIERLKNELKLKDDLIETYHSLISTRKEK